MFKSDKNETFSFGLGCKVLMQIGFLAKAAVSHSLLKQGFITVLDVVVDWARNLQGRVTIR